MESSGDRASVIPAQQRRREILAFLFVTAVLMPALAVATVGGYGLGVLDLSDDCRPAGAARSGDDAINRDRRQFIRGRWVAHPARLPSPAGKPRSPASSCRRGRNGWRRRKLQSALLKVQKSFNAIRRARSWSLSRRAGPKQSVRRLRASRSFRPSSRPRSFTTRSMWTKQHPTRTSPHERQ